VVNVQNTAPISLALVSVDFLFIVIMLCGLLRRRHGDNSGLWQVLWQQVSNPPIQVS
jgi:hypothetical protein